MRETILTILCLASLAACGGGGAAPLTGGAQPGALASLAVSHPEGAMPVGDTLIMQVEAKDATGQPVPNVRPQWSSSDVSVAAVDADGVVRGLKAGAATITASATAGGVTKTAGYAVAVLAVPPPPPNAAEVLGVDDAFQPSAVTIRPGGTVTWRMVDEEHDVAWTGTAPAGGNIGKMDRGSSVSRTFATAGVYAYTCQRHKGKHGGTVTVDGATQAPVFTSVRVSPANPSVAVGATVQLTATPLDQAGQGMGGVPAPAWSSADPARATVSASGVVTGVAVGTVSVTARITHGGVTREASATVAVGTGSGGGSSPSTATVTTPGNTFSPAAVTLATGGTVTWQFTGSTRHNVTFNGAAPTGGNIPDTDAGASVARTFGAAGTYSYQCTRHAGMTGQVIVGP
jgi:plastocyanin